MQKHVRSFSSPHRSFHVISPPISIGLGLLMLAMGLQYLRTSGPIWRQASLFWVTISGLVVAMGIATGIVQEVAFGMNRAVSSRFVGTIFGSRPPRACCLVPGGRRWRPIG